MRQPGESRVLPPRRAPCCGRGGAGAGAKAGRADPMGGGCWTAPSVAICPGREPPFWTVERPVCSYKNGIQNRLRWETLRPLNRPGRARTAVKATRAEASASAAVTYVGFGRADFSEAEVLKLLGYLV